MPFGSPAKALGRGMASPVAHEPSAHEGWQVATIVSAVLIV